MGVMRILHMVGNMNLGGQETFIMNIYRNINREKYQFDFVVHSNKRGFYDDEIEKLGGKIYRITPISKNVFKHISELKRIFDNNDYRVFHRHTCFSIVWIDLLIAKLCNIEKRIVHSHSTKSSRSNVIHYIFRNLMNKFSNIKLACSDEAGIFLCGSNKKNKFEIINNGINVEKFLYNEKIRNDIRNSNGVKEKQLVIGHTGRFDKVKNHKFIIEVFCNVLENKKDVVLWLVGDGIERKSIEEIVREKNIEKYVKFWGNKNNINEILSAIDVFVFPSIYEGLGISLIEAQLSGLPCIVSNSIQNEAIITDNVKKLSLDNSLIWKDEILGLKVKERNVNIHDKNIQKFNILETVKRLEEIYLK